MRYLAIALILVTACEETDVHTVGDCENGNGNCEYGCRNGQIPTDAGACVYSAPERNSGVGTCGETFYTDGVDPNHQGCCVPDNGTIRFHECCPNVAYDGGVHCVE